MPHGTEQHLEHAEHAPHHAHDPFDKRVAVTMAIVAAVLAAVTLLSHRAHNRTLLLMIESGKKKAEASNRWAQYQARAIRRNQFEAFIEMLPVIAEPDKLSDADKIVSRMQAKVNEYKTPAEKEKDPQDPEGLPALMALARGLDAESARLEKESEHAHHQGDRYDAGELFVEFAMVLCAVAVLTKVRAFWYSGIAGGVVGLVVAAGAFLMH